MIDNLSQQQIDIYATNATAIDQPQGTNYTQGVKVGRTIPAKWWNWLFNAVTSALKKQYNDAIRILAELKNVVITAGLTPSASSTTQLSQATDILSKNAITDYINNMKRQLFYYWSSAQCIGLTGSSQTELLYLKPIRGSNGAFYMVLKHVYSSGDTSYAIYASEDLLNWKRVQTRTQAPTIVDFCLYKGKYYCIINANSARTTLLYTSDDILADWSYQRIFKEYGSAVGLRVVNNVLWLVSASAAVYDDIFYHSYYTTNGSSWSDEGEVFKNSNLVEDVIGEVVEYEGGFFLGNMFTRDGINWSQMLSEYGKTVYAKMFIAVNDNGTQVLVFQFHPDEGQWHRKYNAVNATSGLDVRTGPYAIVVQISDHELIGYNTETGKVAYSYTGTAFVSLQLDFPSDLNPATDIFKIDDVYFVGNNKTTNLRGIWTAVTLPEGADKLHYSGVGCCIVADNYFSGDKGATWNEGICVNEPFCAVPNKVTEDITCMAVVLVGNRCHRRVTFNGVNRVIGTTLYLK